MQQRTLSKNSTPSTSFQAAKVVLGIIPITAYNDHLYQLRSLFSRSKVYAMEILNNPMATPSEITVFQKVICSNFIRSSTAIVVA